MKLIGSLYLYAVNEGNCLKLKTGHAYYHQIQGQLYLTGTECCDLVVWTTVDIQIIRICRDPAWAQNITKLTEFYFGKFIPHLMEDETWTRYTDLITIIKAAPSGDSKRDGSSKLVTQTRDRVPKYVTKTCTLLQQLPVDWSTVAMHEWFLWLDPGWGSGFGISWIKE